MATADVTVTVKYRQPDPTPGSAGSVVDTFSDTFTNSFADGDGDNQIEEPFSLSTTLAISTPLSLDCTALPAAFGNIDLAFVKVLAFRNKSTHPVSVGGGLLAVSWLPSAIPIPAGGSLTLIAPLTGFPVTPTTADIIKLDPGAFACLVQIVIAGIKP